MTEVAFSNLQQQFPAPLHLTHLRPQVPPIWAMLPLQCITPPSQQPQFPTYTLQTAELPQPHSFRSSSIICLRSKTSTSGSNPGSSPIAGEASSCT
ncbi:uncharacterized protein K444DRAFT_620016 [Hyaloscypha bicolor E]|uniref:Uncharacterized protein n=1 Tax=Hyaloscypha bicolor E TaxID=1095630 RepID=A0A2J6SNP5_9HELO|nr:uncharacterized protein K444DRAFT_620016 [Hyaloscypha bicolor E]PMD52363.1 hypothetical protein K444DRAFT_620016 [Hyaloscypha bicolor E]